jgi:hypothetical protein
VEPFSPGVSGAGRGVAPGLATKGRKAGTEVRLVLALEQRIDGIVVGDSGQVLGAER